jgi:hypothetical protein
MGEPGGTCPVEDADVVLCISDNQDIRKGTGQTPELTC